MWLWSWQKRHLWEVARQSRTGLIYWRVFLMRSCVFVWQVNSRTLSSISTWLHTAAEKSVVDSVISTVHTDVMFSVIRDRVRRAKLSQQSRVHVERRDRRWSVHRRRRHDVTKPATRHATVGNTSVNQFAMRGRAIRARKLLARYWKLLFTWIAVLLTYLRSIFWLYWD